MSVFDSLPSWDRECRNCIMPCGNCPKQHEPDKLLIADYRRQLEEKEDRIKELEQVLVSAAVVPLEVLAGQIREKPYKELTPHLQAEIQQAVILIREALFKND